jgi:hypothetical protein
VLGAPVPLVEGVPHALEVRQARGQFDRQLSGLVSGRRRRQPEPFSVSCGQCGERGLVGTPRGPDPQRPVNDVIGHRPGRGPPIPLDGGLLDLQQVWQRRARRGPGEPGQLLGRRIVEDERHLHNVQVAGAVEHGSERVGRAQRRLPVLPEPADLLAPLGDRPQPPNRCPVTHRVILAHRPRREASRPTPGVS